MTFDPYNNRVPWSLLTEEEREPFEKADIESILMWNTICWEQTARPFVWGAVYRLAQPEIDYCFDLFDDRLIYGATDEDGAKWLFTQKPSVRGSVWWHSCEKTKFACLPCELKRNKPLPEGVDWKDSLRWRDGV